MPPKLDEKRAARHDSTHDQDDEYGRAVARIKARVLEPTLGAARRNIEIAPEQRTLTATGAASEQGRAKNASVRRAQAVIAALPHT